MSRLSNIKCHICGNLIESEDYAPNSRGGAPSAISFETCLRRCNRCGIGFSNAQNPSSVVKIYRNPLDNIPPEVHDGALETLSNSLNILNRENKVKKFGFETSEDALTWTVFNYLKHKGILRNAPNLLGMDWINHANVDPSLLLWGVPVPVNDKSGINVRKNLRMVLRQIGENPQKLSEPDVILDFGELGIVVIEVKYRSTNDTLNKNSPKWRRYLDGRKGFGDVKGIKGTGYYELARNWRLAWGLAGNRPMTLLNLGQDFLFKGSRGKMLKEFSSYIKQDALHKFIALTWRKFFNRASDPPNWLSKYIRDRNLAA